MVAVEMVRSGQILGILKLKQISFIDKIVCRERDRVKSGLKVVGLGFPLWRREISRIFTTVVQVTTVVWVQLLPNTTLFRSQHPHKKKKKKQWGRISKWDQGVTARPVKKVFPGGRNDLQSQMLLISEVRRGLRSDHWI